ncbi:MAG: hypothetical protein HXX13_17460 [Bacteroidetes bacterium]|nr:hypothetical protein [Bacteroidota bacterium]
MEVSLQRTVNRPVPAVRAAAHENALARVTNQSEERNTSERRNSFMQVAHSNIESRANQAGGLSEILNPRRNESPGTEHQNANRNEVASRASGWNSPYMRRLNENAANRTATLNPSEETAPRSGESARPTVSQPAETANREREEQNAVNSPSEPVTDHSSEGQTGSEGNEHESQPDPSPGQSQIPREEAAHSNPNSAAVPQRPAQETPAGSIQGSAPQTAGNEQSTHLPPHAASPAMTNSASSTGPLSPVKQFALQEYIGIGADSQAAENQVNHQASGRKQWLRSNFENLQAEVESQLAGTLGMLNAIIVSARDRIVHACILAIQLVSNGALGILNAARSLLTAIQGSILALLINVSVSIRLLVMGIVLQISALLSSIPLPDLHGIVDLRAMVNGLISQVIHLVLGGLRMFMTIIRGAIRKVVKLVRRLLQRLTVLINQLLARVLATILRVMRIVIHISSNLILFIGNAVNIVLYTRIIPVLQRTYSRLVTYLDKTRSHALSLIRINRVLYQFPLIRVLSSGNSPGEQVTGNRVTAAVAMALIRQLRRDAARNSRFILGAFILATGGIIEIIANMVISGIRRIALLIEVQVMRVITSASNVLNTVFNMVQLITGVALSFIQQLFGQLSLVLGRMISLITNITNRLSAELLRFCSMAYTNVKDALLRIVRSLLTIGWNFISRLIRQFGQFTPVDSTASLHQSFLQNPINRPFPAFLTRLFNMVRRVSTILVATLMIILPLIQVNIYMLGSQLLISSLVSAGLLLVNPAIRILTGLFMQLIHPVAIPKTTVSEEVRPGLLLQVSYSVPLVNKDIQASKGEKLIFGVEATDTDQQRVAGSNNWTDVPGKGPYETIYEVSGEAELLSRGSGSRKYKVPGLQSRNIYLFISGKWSKKAIQVRARLVDKAGKTGSGTTQDPERIIDWTVIPRKRSVPSGLKKVKGPGDSFVPAPARYSYEGEPGLPPSRPSYEDQTVLESFGATQAYNFEMEDLKPEWRAANSSLDTPDKVAASVSGSSNNGTFVFDHDDRIHDKHSGFSGVEIFKDLALKRAGGVGYSKFQTYSSGGKTIGTAWIYRRYSKSNGLEIRKTGI